MKGNTLLEVMVGGSLLLLITAALFAGWMMGTRAWLSAGRSNDRFGQLLKCTRNLEAQAQVSSSAGLEVQATPGAVAFCSPYGLRSNNEADRFFSQPNGASPAWQKYLIYYHDTALRQVYWREVAIPTGHSASLSPLGLSEFDPGSGAQPLASYLNSGLMLAQQIDLFQPTLAGGRLTVTLESIGVDPSKPGNGRLRATAAVLMRN